MELCYTGNSNSYDVHAVLHGSELRWFVELHNAKCKNLRQACKNKWTNRPEDKLFDLNEYYGAIKTHTKLRVGFKKDGKTTQIAVISAKGTQLFKWPASNMAWKSLFLICYSAVLDGAIYDYGQLNRQYATLIEQIRKTKRNKLGAKRKAKQRAKRPVKSP